jgi:hypothetical protein
MTRRNRNNNGYIGTEQFRSEGGCLSASKTFFIESNTDDKFSGSGVTSFNSIIPDGAGDYFEPGLNGRRPEWIALPNLDEGDQKMCGLVHIHKGSTGNTGSTADSNFVFFTCQGNYIVDWGNGVTQAFSSGQVAQYQYNFNDVDPSTETIYGYRQVVVQAYPQPGATLTAINFKSPRGFTAGIYSTLNNLNWGPSWIEIKIAGRFISSLNVFGGGADNTMGTMERFEYVGESSLTSSFRLFAFMGGLRRVYGKKWLNKCTDITNMFESCGGLLSVEDFEISPAATSVSSLFNGCGSLERPPNFNTQNITNMNGMFIFCKKLQTIPTYNTSNVTNFGGMFRGCAALRTIPLLDTSKGTNFIQFFQDCSALVEIPPIDTRSATSMQELFRGCSQLKKAPQLNTSNVTNFFGMYVNCFLTSIPWMDTSKATSMAAMFWNVGPLKYIPFFDTSKNTSFNSFLLNTAIQSIPPLSGVCATDFASMFGNCPRLKVGTVIGTSRDISYANCNQLSIEELNSIFNNLATVGASGSNTRTITITNTRGSTGCDRSIAIGKGWAVSG